MPALPRNCYRTSNGFIFRVVVPEPLRDAVGKREIKKSLGKDYRDAVSQAHLLAVQVDRQFTELRNKLTQQRQEEAGLDAFVATPLDKRLIPITQVAPELVEGLRSLWLASLEADLACRREGLDDQEYDEIDTNIAEVQGQIAKALARGQPEPFIPVVRGLLHVRGYELAISPEEERRLTLDFLPAIQEGYDILQQRQQGRLVEPSKRATPPLRAAWEPVSSNTSGLTWDGLFEHWNADRPRPVRTVDEVRTLISSLSAFLPTGSPETLSRAQVTEWLRHERKVRNNSAQTLQKKGTLVGALFSVALKDELLDKNPFAGFDYERFAAKEGISDPDEREPFTLDHLRDIFSTDGIFGVTKQVGGGGYHARVWIPLLAVYSGARLDELGSLLLSDILLEPVPHYHVCHAKNQKSIRDIPLHPQLIDLGFLDYVEAIRAAGHERLWPNLRSASRKVDDSEVMGKWFNRFIRTKLRFPPSLVFHSFRHTFKDLCRNAMIPKDLHQALTGHASDTVGDSYGNGFSLVVKLAEMKKIELGIDIPRPMPYGKNMDATAELAR